MSIKTAYSQNASASDAAKEIKAGFGELEPGLVIFFASSQYNPDALAREMQDQFSLAVTIGCTTSGEIISGKMLKNSIVAMAFSPELIDDMNVQILENLNGNFDLSKPFEAFAEYYQEPVINMNHRDYIGIVLEDGMSGAEENLMDQIGNRTDVIFIGGSAGDDLKFIETFVFCNGQAYRNAALLALLKPAVEFGFIKTQSFRSIGKVLEASKVDEAAREVIEFNQQPAADAYAEALGVQPDAVSNYFFENPVAVVSGEQMFIRSPRKLNDNKSIAFYCHVKEGSQVTLVENTDIITDTKQAIAEKKGELGEIQGILNFNCILRTLELESKNLEDEYGNLFSEIPTIGFSTYGESFIGHINQTATMLAFGKAK